MFFMVEQSFVNLKLMNIPEEKLKSIINFFKHTNADLIQFDENDHLSVKLNEVVAKSSVYYIFVQDLEYLVGKNIRTYFEDGFILIDFK
jgi:hypothetical protein